MIEDLQLRGFAPTTQEAYLRAVQQLAEHFDKSPADLTEEDLREYFLHLKNVRQASRSTCTQALCGIKFFFEHTLRRDWKTFGLVRPPKEKKLPVVLSQEEVGRVLICLNSFRYHVCLSTIYSCGLRLREGVQLQIADLDSDRMLIHVHKGKGGKDRYVPLPDRTLCPAARSNPGAAATVLANPSPSTVALSRATATRYASFESWQAHISQ
jgi:site-specific recombinase XerD